MTRINRATLGLLATAVVTVLLTACGPSGDPGQTTSPSAPPTIAPTMGSQTPDQEADVRTRLAAGLREARPNDATLVENPQTKLTEQPADWLTGWTVIDVLNLTPPHPRRFFAALSEDGTVRRLTGKPEEFSAMTQAASVAISSEKDAKALTALYLDSTQDFAHAAYRIDAITDVKWLPKPTAAQDATKQELIDQFADKVGPAAATKTDGGWSVVTWMVYDHRLQQHTVTIGTGGVVADEVEELAKNLPVPISY